MDEGISPQEVGDAKVVFAKWVLMNKGDDRIVDIGARLVACEVNGGQGQEAHSFAATPPLDELRVLFMIASTDSSLWS